MKYKVCSYGSVFVKWFANVCLRNSRYQQNWCHCMSSPMRGTGHRFVTGEAFLRLSVACKCIFKYIKLCYSKCLATVLKNHGANCELWCQEAHFSFNHVPVVLSVRSCDLSRKWRRQKDVQPGVKLETAPWSPNPLPANCATRSSILETNTLLPQWTHLLFELREAAACRFQNGRRQRSLFQPNPGLH